jgi:hypothetical protein
MPSTSIRRAQNHLQHFRRQNIGLISHSCDASSRRILASKKRRPRSRSGFIKAIGMLQQQGD